MLSKVKDGYIEVPKNENITTISANAFSYYQGTNDYSWTATKSGTFTANIKINSYNTYGSLSNGVSCTLSVGGNSYSMTSGNTQTVTFSAKQGDTIRFSVRSSNGNLTFKNDAFTIILTKISVYVTVKYYKLLPRDNINLGNLLKCTLYGKHTDNTYYGGLMIDKDTTATTGSITLGNAVGYIKVNLNGEIVKIPYYK